MSAVLSATELAAIESRCAAASPAPWESFVEGRDHLAGDGFIRVGGPDGAEPDMYLSRAAGSGLQPATIADQDFVAHARQDIPRLLAEVRRLEASNSTDVSD
jgi:hypothetical protein